MTMTLVEADETVLVVDDVVSDPHAFRQLAMNAVFPDDERFHYFPGRNSNRRFGVPALDDYVAHLTGQAVRPHMDSLHATFRVCLADEDGEGGVHADDCHWTGVLYLTRPEDCRGGTSFYRYKANGQSRVPIYEEDWDHWRMSREQLFQDVMIRDGKDMSKWELTQHVEMKFNRLVLFRPWLWHRAGPGFGTSTENGRLVYLLFYKVPGWR